MQVSVNGQIEEIEAQSLDSFLDSKLLLGRRIAVELNGEIVQVAPEYESCRALAASADVPLKVVYDAAVAAAR